MKKSFKPKSLSARHQKFALEVAALESRETEDALTCFVGFLSYEHLYRG